MKSTRPVLFAILPAMFGAIVAPARAGEIPPLPRPLTIETALAYATEHNPALLRIGEQIREQEGGLVTARGARLPALDVTGSITRLDNRRLESVLTDDRGWSLDFTARQVLYAGGGPRAREHGQRERVAASRLAFAAALNDTQLAVRQQFYAVLLDRELIGVQEEALRVLEGELAHARSRRDAGAGSDFDLLRAEVAVANARPALIRARNTYRTAQDQLRAILGAAAPDSTGLADLAVTGELALPPRSWALADAVQAARHRRPELLQQEHLLKAAEMGVTSARSERLPAISAVAGYGWARPSLLTTPVDNLHGWSVGLQAGWNLFDGQSTAGAIAQARSRAQQARHFLDELQLAIEVEVRTAHTAVTEALELLQASTQVVAQARESLRLAQARHDTGTATQLDVLIAHSALTEARSNLAQAQHAYAVARASLQRAIGGTLP